LGRLVTGISIVVFILVVNLVAVFIRTDAASTSSVPGCGGEDDATECENVGKTTFFEAVRDVSVGNIDDDAPAIVNVLWLTVMAIMLTAAVLLIVTAFVPTLSE
jgi:hypothetical protein